jgi:hypothetical protein
MIPDSRQGSLSGAKRHIVTWRAVALSIALGVTGAAAPIGLDFDEGEVSLSSRAALAKHGGGGGGNGGGGGGGNDGGGGGGDGGSGDGGGRDNGNSGVGDGDGSGRDNGNSGVDGGTSTGGTNGSTSSATGAPAAPADGAVIIPILTPANYVTRAQFTTAISKRYPANRVSSLDNPHQAVSFFTELVDMQGQTVTHRWTYRGAVEYQVSFKINGPKWRFWSTHVLPADKPGTWQVELVDEENRVLKTSRLIYQPVG